MSYPDFGRYFLYQAEWSAQHIEQNISKPILTDYLLKDGIKPIELDPLEEEQNPKWISTLADNSLRATVCFSKRREIEPTKIISFRVNPFDYILSHSENCSQMCLSFGSQLNLNPTNLSLEFLDLIICHVPGNI